MSLIQALAQNLVAQGKDVVTIEIGSVPVLKGLDNQWALAVNFLRAGCPKVQVLRAMDPRFNPDQTAEAIVTAEQVKLDKLAIHGEKLVIASKGLFEHHEGFDPWYLFELTRTISFVPGRIVGRRTKIV